MTANLPASDLRQLIPLRDAIAAAWCNSRRAFYDWAKRYGVRAFRHGQYRRADLDAGLAREERVHGVRRSKNLARPQTRRAKATAGEDTKPTNEAALSGQAGGKPAVCAPAV
jgi:hypothetical protein